jgi:SAM-dependent methyltransferase
MAPRILETFGFQKRLGFVRKHLADERVRRGRPLSIVDVGCGTGEALTVPLARDGHATVGIDVHFPSLQVGQHFDTARFLCGDTRALRSGTLDAAVCSEVLEHVGDPRALLADVRRLLRPRGLCLVTVPNGYGPYQATDRAGKLAHRAFQSLGLEGSSTRQRTPLVAGYDSLNHSSEHVQFFTRRALRRHFAATGFDEVAYEGRTFLCGALLSEALALHKALVHANERAGSVLPSALISGWMFALRTSQVGADHSG